MLLRCKAGRYAGEIRDYAFAAGIAAVKAGLAEPIKESGGGPELKRAAADVRSAKKKTRQANK